jgi:hypothetical protein
MGFIVILMGTFIFIYATTGVYLFQDYTNSPNPSLLYQDKYKCVGCIDAGAFRDLLFLLLFFADDSTCCVPTVAWETRSSQCSTS